MSHFEDGVIFWCPQHERALLQKGMVELLRFVVTVEKKSSCAFKLYKLH